ncbi:hypothetical protein V6N12_055732 [Hibiscus sabdariffa]|uniref:Uncharacterized protein n=1 Tax=Hibiscus sabdariffa TaxID=183260 RepID=A0ABR1ZIS6_9ROSI
MADVLLSPLVSTILENLSSLFLEEVVLARSLKTQLKSLESTLTTIQAVLLDAEEKQSKSAALKDWLDKLKHAAYDVEDLLDDFKQEARECSLRKDARSKVYSCLFPRIPLSFRIKMGRKFKDAREKLDAIAAEKNKFHLTEGAGEVTTQPNEDRQTSSLVKESDVLGREDEKEKLRGRRGSTVIVTTRDENIALTMAGAADRVHHLGCLSIDDSWSLFKKRAFGMGMNEDNVNLETIGREIVRRCGGVPLAIKALGNILRFKTRESEWLRVKDSEIWDLEDERKRIFEVLRLSYQHLPSYMKRCFSFCSMFPKDTVMEKDDLIALWMANGFIPRRRGPLDLHDTGCEIFSELTRRSFFQEVDEKLDGTVTCKMHDLIHDLATLIMGHEGCVIEPNERLEIPETARHLLVPYGCSSPKVMDLTELSSLRSLILRCIRNHIPDKFSIPSHFISVQKYMKVLHFDRGSSNAGFESLKHLRYLRLNDSMRTLPESTSSLHNLQTLNLHSCSKLEMLPKGMKHLKNLRYLDLRYCNSLTCMPAGLGQLTCLRKLSKFIVGKDNGCGIDELKELALEGELSITGLVNVKSSREAKNVNLIKKQNLRSLTLSWRVRRGESSHHEHGNDEEILDALQPHSSLKKLDIIDYQGVSFPYWMMDLLLPNLVEISLEDCERCQQLPPLGKLRSLKVLIIKGMGALKYIDSNFYGDTESCFPSLEVLKVIEAPCLEEWAAVNGRQHFPHLTSFTIHYCPKLVKLPMLCFPSLKVLSICKAPCLEEWAAIDGRQHFPLLTSLTIDDCPKLVKLPMPKSLKRLSVIGTSVSLLKSLMTNVTVVNYVWIGEFPELPEGLLQNQKQLEELSIHEISVKPPSNLLDNLSSLKRLFLQKWSPLETLPAGLQNLTCLEDLRVWHCNSLVSLGVNELQGLSSLSSLEINYCKKLRCLSEGVRYLTSLEKLHIGACPELNSLPQSIQHLSSLRSLHIWHCEKLISLPNEIQHLATLSELKICYCSNLVSLPQSIQHLSSLRSLWIEGCEKLISLPNEILQHLAMLSELNIWNCSALMSLPQSIQHLSSLRTLSIGGCDKLISLPNEIQHLAMLSELTITGCSALMSLPRGIRSLTALEWLTIERCPHLERRCQEEDWPTIAHIPHKRIGKEVIFYSFES